MILSRSYESAYPFLESCDLDLGTGNKLGRGVILSANLYPTVDGMNYARIQSIYHRSNPDRSGRDWVGVIDICTDAGDFLCSVEFEAPRSGDPLIIGTAYQGHKVCGCICASHDLLPIFKAHYVPHGDSFIFVPSVVRPRPGVVQTYGLRTQSGELIHEVAFSGDAFRNDGGTITLAGYTTPTRRDSMVKNINIAVVTGENSSAAVGDSAVTLSAGTVGYSNVNIRSGKGCGLRVGLGVNELILGGSKDV